MSPDESDTFVGYVNEPSFQLDSIVEQQRRHDDSEHPPIHLPTRIAPIQSSYIMQSAPMTSSSSNSAETLKTSDLAILAAHEELAVDEKDGTLKADIVSVYNTNNSGHTHSHMFESGDTKYRGIDSEVGLVSEKKRTCLICDSSSQSFLRRSFSFPDRYIMNSYCNKYTAHTKRLVKTFPDKELFYATLKRTNSCGTLADISIKGTHSSVQSRDRKVARQLLTLNNQSSSSPKPSPPDILCDVRGRGNTQTSLDSGVIIDATMTSSPYRTVSPIVRTANDLSDDFLLVHDPDRQIDKSSDDNEWRFMQPRGERLIRKCIHTATALCCCYQSLCLFCWVVT